MQVCIMYCKYKCQSEAVKTHCDVHDITAYSDISKVLSEGIYDYVIVEPIQPVQLQIF